MPVSCEGADLLYALYFHMEPLGLVGARAAQPGAGRARGPCAGNSCAVAGDVCIIADFK